MDINEVKAQALFDKVQTANKGGKSTQSGAFAALIQEAGQGSSNSAGNQPFFMNVLAKTAEVSSEIRNLDKAPSISENNQPKDTRREDSRDLDRNDVSDTRKTETKDRSDDNMSDTRADASDNVSDEQNIRDEGQPRETSDASDNDNQGRQGQDDNNNTNQQAEGNSDKQDGSQVAEKDTGTVQDDTVISTTEVADNMAAVAESMISGTAFSGTDMEENIVLASSVVSFTNDAANDDFGKQLKTGETVGKAAQTQAGLSQNEAQKAFMVNTPDQALANVKATTQQTAAQSNNGNVTNFTTVLGQTETSAQALETGFDFTTNGGQAKTGQNSATANAQNAAQANQTANNVVQTITDPQAATLSEIVGEDMRVTVKAKGNAANSTASLQNTSSLASQTSVIDAELAAQTEKQSLFDEATLGDATKTKVGAKTAAQANLEGTANQNNQQVQQQTMNMAVEQMAARKQAQGQNVVLNASNNTTNGTQATTGQQSVTGIDATQSASSGTQSTDSNLNSAKTKTAQAQRPAPQVPAKEVINQIKVNINKATLAGTDKINIQLRPRELGHIEVKMELNSEGKLTANISASRPETLDLLQKDVRGLERALTDAGLKTDSGSLNFNDTRGEQNQQNQQNQSGNGSHRSAMSANTESELDILSEQLSANHNTVSASGVNIRV